MQQLLDILANAISDVGYWRWWTSDLPESFQIEFGGAQLYFDPPEVGEPPSGLVALHFVNPSDIIFLTLSEEVPSNWVHLLHEDKLEPFPLQSETFVFNDRACFQNLVDSSLEDYVYLGDFDSNRSLADTRISFGFAAYRVGLFVTAEEVELYSIHGFVDLAEVPTLIEEWWQYWQEYWRRKDSNQPMPEDFACEVTIPAG